MNRPTDVELIPELIQLAIIAVDDDVVAVVRSESSLDGRQSICGGF